MLGTAGRQKKREYRDRRRSQSMPQWNTSDDELSVVSGGAHRRNTGRWTEGERYTSALSPFTRVVHMSSSHFPMRGVRTTLISFSRTSLQQMPIKTLMLIELSVAA